ncbi:MAG: hypothetical protein ACTJGT_00575 [Microbacteriaceae bacterium]
MVGNLMASSSNIADNPGVKLSRKSGHKKGALHPLAAEHIEQPSNPDRRPITLVRYDAHALCSVRVGREHRRLTINIE